MDLRFGAGLTAFSQRGPRRSALRTFTFEFSKRKAFDAAARGHFKNQRSYTGIQLASQS